MGETQAIESARSMIATGMDIDSVLSVLRETGTTTMDLLAVLKAFPTVPHIKVEFDLGFFGGDYTNVGKHAYVPLPLVDMLDVEEAFRLTTGHDPVHIVHYESGRFYMADGDPYRDPEDIIDDL
jgi:hypothetical protein